MLYDSLVRFRALAWMFPVVLAWAAPMAVADQWPPVIIGAAEAEIEGALDDKTTLEFIETPLQDVVDYLKDLHGIEIQIDTRALEEVGLGSDTPITRNLKGISLRSAMRHMLKEIELTIVVRDEVLLITTPEEAEGEAYVEVYDVTPLVNEKQPVAALAEVLRATCDVDLQTFGDLLIANGTHRGHQQMRVLLGKMANGLGVEPPKVKIARERPMPMGRPRDVARRPKVAAPRPPAREIDPFGGGGGDPFGGGGVDPFGGGGEDPFGGGGGAFEDDPFAENPFAEPRKRNEKKQPMPVADDPFGK